MPQEFEERTRHEVRHIILAAREEIVDAQHVVASSNQSITEMRAEESGTSTDKHPLALKIGRHPTPCVFMTHCDAAFCAPFGRPRWKRLRTRAPSRPSIPVSYTHL